MPLGLRRPQPTDSWSAPPRSSCLEGDRWSYQKATRQHSLPLARHGTESSSSFGSTARSTSAAPGEASHSQKEFRLRPSRVWQGFSGRIRPRPLGRDALCLHRLRNGFQAERRPCRACALPYRGEALRMQPPWLWEELRAEQPPGRTHAHPQFRETSCLRPPWLWEKLHTERPLGHAHAPGSYGREA